MCWLYEDESGFWKYVQGHSKFIFLNKVSKPAGVGLGSEIGCSIRVNGMVFLFPPLDYKLLVGGAHLSHHFISKPDTQSLFNGCLSGWMDGGLTVLQ